MHELWPHQVAGVEGTLAAFAAGLSPVCLTGTTGSGKSREIAELVWRYVSRGRPALLYCNRRLLIDQLSRSMLEMGLEHGVRAAGLAADHSALFQIASIQTDDERSMRVPAKLKQVDEDFALGNIGVEEYLRERHRLQSRQRDLFPADLVVFDEGHLMTGPRARAIITHYVNAGSDVVLFTATPIGLDFCRQLIVAGLPSECRRCGATVMARHHGCDEPDMKKLRLRPDEEISERQAIKAVMTAGIFGRVLEQFQLLNPRHLPTLLFAPGVRESVWFAEQFLAAGIRSAHIDGEDLWLDGCLEPTSSAGRDKIIALFRGGDVKVICNRFVMREGIDLPFVRHGVLATMFGSLQSYLQAGGRFLRSDRDEETNARYGPKEFVTIQDHGGHWWRLGSLNEDRNWQLGLPGNAYVGARQERIRSKKAPEPLRCPQCGLIMLRGVCPTCGKTAKRSRLVREIDGQLVEHEEPLFAPRRELEKADTQKLWERCYFGAKYGKSGMTFLQAMGWFVSKHHYWPPRTLRYMPLNEYDFYLRVRSVPPERLRL
jgi:superfamily II DNA or RNA helicase